MGLDLSVCSSRDLIARTGYPSQLPRESDTEIRRLTGSIGVATVFDGVDRSTFDASLVSLAVRGTRADFTAASGPFPPVDPQRLHATGSVYLTRPLRTPFNRTYTNSPGVPENYST